MPWKSVERAGPTVFIWAGYSLAERDRRWQAVRESAAKAGFDCIFVPLGNGIDGRYLTQLRCSSLVLPTDGRAPIVIADRASKNEWVPDPWQTNREWAEPMSEALLEAGMERARIGVVGLRGGKVTHVRAPDGVVNHTAFTEVMRRLTNAVFDDATDVVGLVRYRKSAEEMSFLEKASKIAESGIDEMIRLARPGLDGAALYAAVTEHVLELRSEYYPLAMSMDHIDAALPKLYSDPPLGRRLESGALITSEVNAIAGAQLVQESQPILLGRVPAKWQSVIDLQKDVFQAGLELMKPGTRFGEFIDLMNKFGSKHGMKTKVCMHGCGYGDDGPVFSPRSDGREVLDLSMERDNVWVWKPVAMSADEQIRFAWGGCVRVTEHGGEVVFKRPHGMVSVV